MPKKTTYNHRRRIQGRQPAGVKAILPGMFVEFMYKSPNASDIKPMVIVLHRDLNSKLIHGINLNYMTENEIKRVMVKLQRGSGVYTTKNQNVVRIEDQDSSVDTDDQLPNRNLLKKEFSRIHLPVFKMEREGNPMSLSESKRQMKMLYDKVLKKFVNRWDIYRTYSMDKIKNIRVLELNLDGLLK
tara:strand:- start:43564 stop:44121 length:558 start_codon:yes stop_codon:yes gene_type:complete